MPLTSVIAKVANISHAQKDAMFLLYSRYYDNIDRNNFHREFNEKDWVIVLQDGDDIAGFSTLQVIRLEVGGRERLFLFSGDTIVDRAHWQDSKLAGSFGHFMLRMMAEHNGTPLYWFLISKGYRTYRFLPVYFKSFYPAYNRVTPDEYSSLMQAVASHKFRGAFDCQSGLIRFGGQKDRLKPAIGEIPESRKNDPHVRFFQEMNPMFNLGDELACIADISRTNLNKYAWRVIENTRVMWDE